MLEIIYSRRRLRDFLVYDLEWIPGTMTVRLIGVYDGKRYRAYKSVKDFLNNELNYENRGRWFYAHAGGLADIQFLFEDLIGDDRFTIKASFSGSSAIIVHVGKGTSARNKFRGPYSLGHDVYHFIDSYWTLRDSLRNIGKSIGLDKGGEELRNDGTDEKRLKKWFAEVPLHELMEYNKQDCFILWHALNQFQQKLWEFGGQLQMTLASSAMQLFRRQYLTEDIPTDEDVNNDARMSYFSSRVEVFASDCIDSNYYDINSSFPYSMTKPVPGECTGGKYGKLPREGSLFLAECDVSVPESFLPPTPIRKGGRVFFPTGRWKGWFNNIDLELLESEGGRIHRVYSVHSFRPFTDLAEYATSLYERRKATKDEFEKYCYKLLLNSLYGKFAESDLKTGLFINPSLAIMKTFNRELTQRLMPGVYLHPEAVKVPHMHVPISSHITANSRKVLYDFLCMTDDFHYTDTDGFSTGDVYPTSKELGGLKLEKRITKGKFVQPKLYQLEGRTLKDGEWQNETITKAKGFSLGKDKKKAEMLFLKLVNDGEIRISRMDRVRQLLRSAGNGDGKKGPHPRENQVVKKLQKSVMGKRFMYPDGTTRPWSVEELEEEYGK